MLTGKYFNVSVCLNIFTINGWEKMHCRAIVSVALKRIILGATIIEAKCSSLGRIFQSLIINLHIYVGFYSPPNTKRDD